MHLDVLIRRQQSCVSCPDQPPACNCPSNQACILINRDCLSCASVQCVARSGSSGSSPTSSSKGALAGAIVGSLLLILCVAALWFWYRRHIGPSTPQSAAVPEDVPAKPDAVLNRPNPTEKLSTRENNAGGTQNPTSANEAGETRRLSVASRSVHTNPFEDHTSIQTAGTEGSNVIPIALVPRDQSVTSESPTTSTGPVRPPRSPDLDLNVNLEHVNISREGSRSSGITRVSTRASNRDSYMSGASFSSEFLNEAPVIVNSQGAVRQVLNTSKAEVVKTPNSASSTRTSADTLRVPGRSTRPGGSPLAISSFGPSEIASESNDGQDVVVSANPFGDENSSTSASTLRQSAEFPGPNVTLNESRPNSVITQTGSVAEFGNATRVYIGASPGGKVPPFKTAMGKLVSAGTLGEQQQRAIAHARAQAQLQGEDRRTSSSSMLTSASGGADSILEGFPFVPPSPISNRPIRTPPASPLGMNTFIRGTSPTPTNQTSAERNPPLSPLDPPDRQRLGLSTSSGLSTASTGLDSFTFQIEPVEEEGPQTESGSSTVGPRQRASLDTLAITKDLSSYPLGFDREGRDSLR